ncbi:endonuclease VII domain-containing protein [Microbacterium jejuense]|uniref:endonuclease VII domain-containing protein n=1 Tax=Microbacterium jejuense TaxID=1263637 RepID=UPI0031E77F8F
MPYSREYYLKNRERLLAEQKERDRKRDPEKAREYRRAYYERNKERLQAQQRERGRRNYAAQPQAYRARSRKARLKTYGLTPESYAAMLESQGGKCKLCGLADDRMPVDHSHETGEVRGILCTSCNTGLGLFREDTALMLRAIEYLTRSSSGVTSTTSRT